MKRETSPGTGAKGSDWQSFWDIDKRPKDRDTRSEDDIDPEVLDLHDRSYRIRDAPRGLQLIQGDRLAALRGSRGYPAGNLSRWAPLASSAAVASIPPSAVRAPSRHIFFGVTLH